MDDGLPERFRPGQMLKAEHLNAILKTLRDFDRRLRYVEDVIKDLTKEHIEFSPRTVLVGNADWSVQYRIRRRGAGGVGDARDVRISGFRPASALTLADGAIQPRSKGNAHVIISAVETGKVLVRLPVSVRQVKLDKNRLIWLRREDGSVVADRKKASHRSDLWSIVTAEPKDVRRNLFTLPDPSKLEDGRIVLKGDLLPAQQSAGRTSRLLLLFCNREDRETGWVDVTVGNGEGQGSVLMRDSRYIRESAKGPAQAQFQQELIEWKGVADQVIVERGLVLAVDVNPTLVR